MRSRSELASGRGAFFTGTTRAAPEDDDPAPPEGRAQPERLTSVQRRCCRDHVGASNA